MKKFGSKFGQKPAFANSQPTQFSLHRAFSPDPTETFLPPPRGHYYACRTIVHSAYGGGGNNLPPVLGRTSSSPAQMAGSGLSHIKKRKKICWAEISPT